MRLASLHPLDPRVLEDRHSVRKDRSSELHEGTREREGESFMQCNNTLFEALIAGGTWAQATTFKAR